MHSKAKIDKTTSRNSNSNKIAIKKIMSKIRAQTTIGLKPTKNCIKRKKY